MNLKTLAAGISLACCLAPHTLYADDGAQRIQAQRPADVVDVGAAIPQMQFDMRYASAHNFVGRRIHGYEAAACLLTTSAVNALKNVEQQLLPMGLTLKAYDCYRPQRAVDDFVQWAADPHATAMRGEFYVSVPKDRLFSDGYIAAHSGHSRASTIDLTIVPAGSAIPRAGTPLKLKDCTAPQAARFPDNSLDFGTGYDCFSVASHPSFQDLSAQARANRLLLRTLMMQAGFAPLETEWWHFTLKSEPYPDTYFDFPVRHVSP